MGRLWKKMFLVRLAAGMICLIAVSCGNEITTEPVMGEGFFPLKIGNRWTYALDTGEKVAGVGDEVWQITDRKGVWVGSALMDGYTLARRNTFDGLTTEETLFVDEGLVYSLGLSSSPLGTPSYRYAKATTPESMRGILSPSLPQEVSIQIERLDSISVNPQVHPEARAATYNDCIRASGSLPAVLSVSETSCLGVGPVERVETDLITGKTKRWTIVFFELRK